MILVVAADLHECKSQHTDWRVSSTIHFLLVLCTADEKPEI